ncbi:hypothetical protein Barb6XT_03104 [Bacteroidales bacterium Barb6XT]|nr:hypothetical protein Barb6XT_03104 [Bacteroidales bacterium Barb6XT]
MAKVLEFDPLSSIINVESILFGFILTVLTLLMQLDNKSMRTIKEYGRYPQLIGFNKTAAYSSFFAIAFTLVLILYPNGIDLSSPYCLSLFYAWEFVIALSFLSTYRFMRIFFIIAKHTQ